MPTLTPTPTEGLPIERGAPRILACALAGACAAALAMSPDAITLRGKHEILRDAFASSPFQRPLVVQSSAANDELKGEIYVIVDQPFKVTAQVLKDKVRWCELLMVHQNVKRCRPAGDAPAETIGLAIGRKAQHTAEQGYKMDFTFSVPTVSPDFMQVQMASEGGPLSTRDHRLTLKAAPLDAKSSFLHLSYSYSFGGVARMATQAYLTTAGRDKVGFTVTGKTDEGKPVYINGVRGMVERTAMRYYLAIEAYFGAMSAPPAEQQDKRLRDWFALTEQYPTQLHEMERDEYLAIKRRDLP